MYPVTDGFTFLRDLRCGLQFLDLVLEQYEDLRRSGGMRNRTWLVPKDSNILIPARDSYEYQVPLVPGSAIWGYCFIADTADPEITPPGTLSFNIRDGCNDQPLFSEVVTRLYGGAPPYPTQLLSKLLILGRPGLLNVEICNTYATAMLGQLALYGGEPV